MSRKNWLSVCKDITKVCIPVIKGKSDFVKGYHIVHQLEYGTFSKETRFKLPILFCFLEWCVFLLMRYLLHNIIEYISRTNKSLYHNIIRESDFISEVSSPLVIV